MAAVPNSILSMTIGGNPLQIPHGALWGADLARAIDQNFAAITPGTGTVTSVSGSGGSTGLTLTGGPITGAGTLTLGGQLDLVSHVQGILLVANGGTGLNAFGAGVATWLGTPSSANLAAAMTDETGTGALVFANSPNLVTPNIGHAFGTDLDLTSSVTNHPLSNVYNKANDAGGGSLAFGKDRAGAIVQNGDVLGNILFGGWNGTAYDLAAYIVAQVGGVPGASNDMPGTLSVYVTPDGSATPTLVMTLTTSLVTIQSNLTVNNYIKQIPIAVASLIAAATAGAGAKAFVNNSNATMTAGIGAVVAGGGANQVPVYSDGTNWRIG